MAPGKGKSVYDGLDAFLSHPHQRKGWHSPWQVFQPALRAWVSMGRRASEESDCRGQCGQGRWGQMLKGLWKNLDFILKPVRNTCRILSKGVTSNLEKSFCLTCGKEVGDWRPWRGPEGTITLKEVMGTGSEARRPGEVKQEEGQTWWFGCVV